MVKMVQLLEVTRVLKIKDREPQYHKYNFFLTSTQKEAKNYLSGHIKCLKSYANNFRNVRVDRLGQNMIEHFN